MSKLLFQPWQTVIEPAFWGMLGDYKLETLKLDEGPLDITATYKPNNHPQIPGVLSLDPDSLNLQTNLASCTPPSSSPALPCTVHGQLYCLNTIERVTTFDRQDIVAQTTSIIWHDILTGRALENPSLLQKMIALVYCDLKLYKYHYWLGFPVVSPPEPYTLHSGPQTVEKYFSSSGAAEIKESAAEVMQESTLSDRIVHVLERYCTDSSSNSHDSSAFLLSVDTTSNDQIECHSLPAWQQQFSKFSTQQEQQNKASKDGVYLVIADTSNAMEYPGWSLRNALLLAAVHFRVPMLCVLCLRTVKGRPSAQTSVVFEVNLPLIPENYQPGSLGGWDTSHIPSPGSARAPAGPRVADLGAMMDPRRLAASAVDLNLQLMRWRAAPSLDTSKIANTKCLLLGAGTLGCSVARCLLGWGVRKITFVDSGKVAYSNPVRQSLFEFEDCLQGGKPKAVAAADAVRRIFPDVDATGVDLNIPMPGHPPSAGVESEVQRVLECTAQMDALVEEHDVVFMLLDTRESRWLGTVMCAAAATGGGGDGDGTGGKKEKLAITAALGFESFVVMRHGASIDKSSNTLEEEDRDQNAGEDLLKKETKKTLKAKKQQQRLGCYFCSDVIGPANSTRDRTMDQQCTVARPGLSGIAGSLAVEVMAAVLQHPLGVHAPPAGAVGGDVGQSQNEEEESLGEEEDEGPLGSVPHMIRGHLSGFSQTCLTGYAFPACPACSPIVVEQYRSRGTEFVLQAVSQPRYLEDLTGLSDLQREMEGQLEEFRLQKEREEEEKEGNEKETGGDGDDEDWEEL